MSALLLGIFQHVSARAPWSNPLFDTKDDHDNPKVPKGTMGMVQRNFDSTRLTDNPMHALAENRFADTMLPGGKTGLVWNLGADGHVESHLLSLK